MTNNSKKIAVFIISCMLICCGGRYEFSLKEVQDIPVTHNFPGTVNLAVAVKKSHPHEVGSSSFKVHLQEAVEKQYKASLAKCFTDGYKDEQAQTNIIITSLDTSIFPIAWVITDIRIFFKVEIFDVEMKKQKTVTIYGFGSDEEGDRALEKAVVNSFQQLLPYLEELFVR